MSDDQSLITRRDAGGMDTNESFSHKFDKPGTYHFTCSIHPRMIGTIVVQ
jgi:plastocyanin